jgi:hypothetical protein
MKRILVTLILVLALVLTQAMPALAATSADVTVTATPTYIAMTNSEPSWAIGTVAASFDSYFWTADGLVPAEPLADGDMKSIITNTGSVAEDIDIKCANFTGGVGWTLSADQTPNLNEVSLRAGITGMANRAAMVQVVNGDLELVNSLASSGTKMWCMELETGTFGDGVGKSGTVTVTASAAD